MNGDHARDGAVRGFAMVPGWLLSAVSAHAVILWCRLWLHADRTTRATSVSVPTLMAEMEVSDRRVRDLLTELVDAGAIVRRRRFNAASVTTLVDPTVQAPRVPEHIGTLTTGLTSAPQVPERGLVQAPQVPDVQAPQVPPIQRTTSTSSSPSVSPPTSFAERHGKTPF